MSDRLPSLNALHAFDVAARCGSFTQAAQVLHVTHGAISRQVRTLEQQLGIRLFVKEGRGLRLTDAGTRLQETTQMVFERLAQTCQALQHQSAVQTPFVLGCPGSILARWFIPRLERLNRALPELRLQLCATDPIPEQPKGLDALLWFAESLTPSQRTTVFKLTSERIGPVLSPLHPHYATLMQAPVAALLKEPLLHTQSRPQAWPCWAKMQGFMASDLHLGQGFEHLYYLLEAALTGLGVAIAPHLLVADDLRSGRLAAPWGFVETSAQLAVWLNEPLEPRAQALMAWLQQELALTAL